MRRTLFDDAWTVGAKANSFAELIAGAGSAPLRVTLPHDAMIAAERSAAGRGATAYFPSGSWEYKKSFELPPGDAGSAVFLEFDGVYRDALGARATTSWSPIDRAAIRTSPSRSTICCGSVSPTR